LDPNKLLHYHCQGNTGLRILNTLSLIPLPPPLVDVPSPAKPLYNSRTIVVLVLFSGSNIHKPWHSQYLPPRRWETPRTPSFFHHRHSASHRTRARPPFTSFPHYHPHISSLRLRPSSQYQICCLHLHRSQSTASRRTARSSARHGPLHQVTEISPNRPGSGSRDDRLRARPASQHRTFSCRNPLVPPP
jgi:hypothetical protein